MELLFVRKWIGWAKQMALGFELALLWALVLG
jgi:hypothetical protein